MNGGGGFCGLWGPGNFPPIYKILFQFSQLFYAYVIRRWGGGTADKVANVILTHLIAYFASPVVVVSDKGP